LWGAKSQAFKEGYGYLTSLLSLLDYFDGPSLYRAIKVNPNNPWAEFDPEHFELFKSTQDYYTDMVCYWQRRTGVEGEEGRRRRGKRRRRRRRVRGGIHDVSRPNVASYPIYDVGLQLIYLSLLPP
jgi:hypothetical protein